MSARTAAGAAVLQGAASSHPQGRESSTKRWDCHRLDLNQSWKSGTDAQALQALIERLKPLGTQVLIVLEATGGLERKLAAGLMDAGLTVAIVNPRQVRDFAKGHGLLAKTDSIDARVLALFAQKVTPRPSVRTSDQQAELEALVVRRRQLVELRTMENNRLPQTPSKAAQKSITTRKECDFKTCASGLYHLALLQYLGRPWICRHETFRSRLALRML